MKPLKYFLAGIVAVLVIIIAAATYFVATFDANAYKPQIIELVKEKKHRTLRLDGDIKLSIFPSLGAEVGRMWLSEQNSDREFAAMDSARVSLELFPLLARNFVVDELTIKGLHATIVREKTGATNVDDLIGKEAPEQPPAERQQVKFDIAHVALDNAAIEYRDDTTGARYALSSLSLKTGRITPDVPTKVELKTAARSNTPKLDIVLDAKTKLTFNVDRQTYKLDDLALEVKGQAAEFTNLTAKASGSVAANLQSGEFSTDKLSVSGTGMRDKEKLEFKLDAPRLAMTKDKASGEKIAVALTMTSPDASTTLNATLPGIDGTAKSFRSAAMTLDVERKQPDQTLKAKIVSPLSGNLEARQFSLPQLKATVSIAGPKLPGQGLAGELSGNASVDGLKKRAQAHLAGKVADSAVKARVDVAAFAPLAFDFDVDIDQLDVERFTGPAQTAKAGDKPAAGAAAKQPDKPLDLSALRDLRANGALRVGALKTSKLKASNVRVDVKASGGRVDLNPVSAGLYQGALSGGVSINAAPATPTFAVKQSLTGVSVGPLLHDLSNTDALEGKGNVTVNVTTQGNTMTALKKALTGSAAVKLTDGAVKGIDIAGAIRKAQSVIGNLKGQAVQQQTDTRQRTDFSELTATFDIRNGIARNNDLSIKSPLLRVSGAGEVNIGEDTLDYTVKASLVASTAGQGGKERADLRGITVPVRVSGPIASPSYHLDFNAMVTDTARQKIEDTITKKLEERLGGTTGSDAGKPKEGQSGRRGLEESLRGLFGK
jgi:AsmA protein